MKSKRNGLGLALLALSLSFGGSLVRAEEPASPFENIVSDPLAKVVQTIELRLAGVEATMMAFAGSFSSDHITTQRLCVSDGSGETCITRAQLDALLKISRPSSPAKKPALRRRRSPPHRRPKPSRPSQQSRLLRWKAPSRRPNPPRP
jgi:hypothetical protein